MKKRREVREHEVQCGRLDLTASFSGSGICHAGGSGASIILKLLGLVPIFCLYTDL